MEGKVATVDKHRQSMKSDVPFVSRVRKPCEMKHGVNSNRGTPPHRDSRGISDDTPLAVLEVRMYYR